MNQKSILKFIGLSLLFVGLVIAQPVAKELDRELKLAGHDVSIFTSVLNDQISATSAQSSAIPLASASVSATPIIPPSIEQNVLGIETSATASANFFEIYPVVKVVDGDTIKVNIGGKTETIRILGMNTPETVDPRKAVECFGKEASAQAKLLLTDKRVSLESDVTQGDRDKYGRLLRYVFLEDGTDYGLSMIQQGYAHEYLYDTPYKYRQSYVTAQQEAARQKVGLWADGACPN